MTARTIEQILKFDSGLLIGDNLVEFTKGERTRRAIIRIGARGAVYGMMAPAEGDMYSAFDRIKADKWVGTPGAIKLWGAKDPEFMKQFAGAPRAVIPL